MNAMNANSTAATSMPLPAPAAPITTSAPGAPHVQHAQPTLAAAQAALAPVQPAPLGVSQIAPTPVQPKALAPGAPPVRSALATQPAAHAPPSAGQHAPSSAPSPPPSCAPSLAHSLPGLSAASWPRPPTPAPPQGPSASRQARKSSRHLNRPPTLVSLSQAEISKISESEKRQQQDLGAGVAMGQGQLGVLDRLRGLSLHAANPVDNEHLAAALSHATRICDMAPYKEDDSIAVLCQKLGKIAAKAGAMERALLLLVPPDRRYEVPRDIAEEANQYELHIFDTNDQNVLDQALWEAAAIRWSLAKYTVFDPDAPNYNRVAPKPSRKIPLHSLLNDSMASSLESCELLAAQYPNGMAV